MTPAKVKIKADIFDSQTVYTIRSKDLIAALGRATIILTALGERVTDFEYALDTRPGKTDRHFIYIYA